MIDNIFKRMTAKQSIQICNALHDFKIKGVDAFAADLDDMDKPTLQIFGELMKATLAEKGYKYEVE